MIRTISLLLVALLSLTFLAACGSSKELPVVTTAPDGTDSATYAAPETSADSNAAVPGSTAAPETKAPETTAAAEIKTVSTVWHFGYVGSSSNSSYTYVINSSGTYYSYTDVITLEKAGTEVWFTDNNTNSNGDKNFASAAALVVSSWKKSGSAWLIDQTGTNIAGSGSTDSVIATNESDAMVYRYVTTYDNESIRLCFRSGQTSAFTPAAYPAVYFRETSGTGTAASLNAAAKDYADWMAESKLSSYYKSLEGLTMYTLGDSYFAGDALETKYVWCSLLAGKYGMTYTNKGKNGSAISDCTAAAYPMVSRYTELPVAGADIILLEGGKNDFNNDVPIGTNSDVSTKTFKGALQFLIGKLQTRYPGALIVCVTVWNTAGTNSLGLTVSDYGQAMIEVCTADGIPCFNSMDTAISGVDMTSAVFRSMYCLTSSDISHLNIAGHRMVLPKFEKFIADAYEAHLALNKS